MNCRRVVSLMSAYVDGELTGMEMLAIRRHLAECSECAEEHESIRFTKQAVASLRSVAPRPELAVAILAKLAEAEVPRYHRVFDATARFLHARLSPVAAALAASGVALVILSAGGMDAVRPQPAEMVATASVRQAGFLGGLAGESIPIASSKPLVVADDAPGLGSHGFGFASLSSK